MASRSTPGYFTDAELLRLWPELARLYVPVYDYLVRAAVTTGCRQGELIALRWSDVKLLERELRVAAGYVQGIGVQTTKSKRERAIRVT